MLVAVSIKTGFIVVGIVLAILSVCSLVKRSTTPGFSVIWVLFGFVLILTGVFIEPYNWSNMIGIPTLIFIGVLGLVSILLFWYLTKKIDQLQHKFNETAIQLTLLTDKNEHLEEEITHLHNDINNTYLQINSISKIPSFFEDKKMQHKNVLFVNNTLSTGGAEKMLLSMLEKFVKHGNNVHLYVITGMGELVGQLPAGVKLLNEHFDEESVLTAAGKKKLTNKVLEAESKGFAGMRLFGYQFRALANMFRNGKIQAEKLAWRVLAETTPVIPYEYDLAVAFTEGAATYYISSNVAAKRKVAFVHTPYLQAGYTKQLDYDAYDNIDEILAVSDSVRSAFLNVHPECSNKTSVYTNTIDVDKILQQSKAVSNDKCPWDYETNFNKAKILTVARLVALKSYDKILDAAKILKDNNYKFSWIALGEGEDRKIIQDKIDKLGLSNNFILYGNVLNPYTFMARCDVYVHATSYEGRSVAVQEAKALACPIVLSKVSGNESMIKNNYSGIFCKLDAKDIAKKVAYMLDNPQEAKQMGRNAQKSMIE